MKSLYRRLGGNERQKIEVYYRWGRRGSSAAREKYDEGVGMTRGNGEGVRSFLYLNDSLTV